MTRRDKFAGAKLAGLKRAVPYTSVLAIALSSPVYGQVEEAPPESISNNENGTSSDDSIITVTGTRLKSGNNTSPVTVFTQEFLTSQGITTVEDALRLLPQNTVSTTASTSLDGTSSRDSLGVGGANLRGFGNQNTLVLVNGRRPAGSPSNLDRGANTNAIPFAAIERIEVLTEGASAIYGADAVAGVINIILKAGADIPERASIRYDIGENGGDRLKADFNFGTSWDSGNLSGAVTIEKQQSVTSSALGYTTNDFTALGGPDVRRNIPQFFPGAFSTANQTIDLNDGFGPFPPGFFPPGTFVDLPGQFLGGVNPGRNASMPVTLADFDPANVSPFDTIPVDLTSERESVSGYLNFQQDISERFSIFAEGNFSFSEDRAELDAPINREIAVPASNAFNGTGQELVAFYEFDGEVAAGLISNSRTRTETESYGFTVGGNYELGFGGWELDGSISYGREQLTVTDLFVFPDEARFAQVLADPNPATALNVFGDGSQQNASALAALFPAFQNLERNTLWQYQLSAKGNLFELPAGTVSTVVGVDFRNEKSLLSASTRSSTRTPQRDVLAVFSELGVPIISSDMDIPGISSFEIRLAARWEEYSIDAPFDGQNIDRLFSNTSPSAGFAWNITPSLKIRGNIGQSFRAPLIADLVRTEPNPGLVGINNNLAAAGVTVDPVTGLPIVDVPLSIVGNPELGPELSDTWSIGGDWRPRGGPLDGLNISATYTSIKTDDVIGNTFSLIFLAPELFLEQGVSRDANDIITGFLGRPLNFSEARLRALDLEVRYNFDTDWGKFDLGFLGTRTLESSTRILAGEPRVRREGLDNGPDKTKFTTWIDWSKNGFGARLTANYSSAYDNVFTDINTQVEQTQRVSDYLTFDLAGRYESESGWTIIGGARNIANADFPLFFNPNGAPFDSRRVDVRGRTIFLEVSKAFNIF